MFNINPSNIKLLELMKNNKNLFACEGVAFTLIGIFALLLPTLFSLTLDYFLGWLLIIAAIITGVRLISVGVHQVPNPVISIVSTLVLLFLGFVFLAYPISGIMTLTLLLAIYFIFDGFVKTYSSLQLKSVPGWTAVMASGIISLVLAFLILASWPTESPWVLGVLIGINFLCTGLAMLVFLWNLRKLTD